MESKNEIHDTRMTGVRRRGRVVFVALALLTALEFAVSVWFRGLLPALALIALAKAGLIVVYFMHLGQMGIVWRQEVSR